MKLSDSFWFSYNNLKHRRLRSWLTIIGIVIGVAAVVALVSIGQGLEQSVKSQLSALGGNFIFITPGFSRAVRGFGPEIGGGGFASAGSTAGNLTENDLNAVRGIPGIQIVTGVINERATVKYINEAASINVQGADPDAWRVFNSVGLDQGRAFKAGDNQVVILGYSVANRLFKGNVQLNRILTVNAQGFRVIGVLKQGGQGAQTDNLVVIPMANARQLFTDISPNQYSAIIAKVSENYNATDVTNQAQLRLLATHKVSKDKQDFSVTSSESILATVSQIGNTISLFLGGIAGISLLVGGIGIANTMLMSVIERTRQIGILKSLGATNIEVMKLFLIESAMMGLIGGIAGVSLGFAISQMLPYLGLQFVPGGGRGGLTTSVSPDLALSVIAFSMLIGAVSGIIPARRAAKLQPIEALRYE